jgi:hypothetical protein
MSKYLKTISSPNLEEFVNSADEVFPKFITVNKAYSEQLLKMKDLVGNYFADVSLQRPLSYLILGPPGAGKSFLMNALVRKLEEDQSSTDKESISKDKKRFAFQSINLSEVVDPRELHKVYEKIRENEEKQLYTLTLIDEVDVRWAGSSAIKHLINPMYDGQYWDGAKFTKFGRCAFFFAGSYLQDRETLLKTQEVLSGLDLSKFFLDVYLEVRKQRNTDALNDLKQLQDFCYVQEMWRAHADPHVDTILYLRSLEKIRDFLSRIAGNYFEMIDVAAPLHVTHEPFNVTDGVVTPTPRLKPIEVARFVKRSEKGDDGQFLQYRNFESPSQPLLEYKDVLLRERLLRVIGAIVKRFEKSWPADMTEFKIRRKLLNLLTVAPLINGMRSLEQLVNLLDSVDPARPELVKRSTSFKLEELSMVLHNAEDFSDADQVWFKLKIQNQSLQDAVAKVDENGLVTIPVKRKAAKPLPQS